MVAGGGGLFVSGFFFLTLAHPFVLTCVGPRQECAMHVDGAEEDLQDELENVSSDEGELLSARRWRTVMSACVILPTCCREAAVISGLICPLFLSDESDCSSPSAASVILQPG